MELLWILVMLASLSELVCIGSALVDVLDEIITAYRIKKRRAK